MSAHRPPRLSRKCLSVVLPSSLRGEAVLGDLEEEFRRRVERDGAFRARWWYRRQAWRVLGVYALPRKRPTDPMEILSPSEAARRSNALESLWQDLRHAVRVLGRSPGVSGLVVLALALGIGANTAIFSVIDAVLLSPLPFERPERVVQIIDGFESQPNRDEVPLSFPNFRDYERAGSFRHVAAIRPNQFFHHDGDEYPRVVGVHISSELLAMMGVEPVLGRGFLPEEDQLDPEPVAIVSHRYWQDEMGGDPSALGQSFTVSRWLQGRGWQPMSPTVVGVMPQGFRLPALHIGDDYRVWTEPDFYLPLGNWDWGRGNRGMYSIRAVAELAPGVTLARAREEMAGIARGIAESDPDAAGLFVRVVPLTEIREARYGPALLVLWGASALILLVVCANVASLLLGRALARERELAVRTTLGASRRRLFRLLFTESLALAALGTGAGIVLAHWGTALLKGLTPGDVHGLAEAGLDLQVLLFSVGAALVTVLLFGLGPALRGAQADPAESLRSGARGGSIRGLRPMRWLVVGQIGVSLALLVGAGLLIRSLDELLDVDPGFDPQATIRFVVRLPPPDLSKHQNDEARLVLFRQVQDRLESVAGVMRAGGAQSGGPLSGQDFGTAVTMADRPAPPPEERATAHWYGIAPGFLEAVGTPILRGRGLTHDDVIASLREARRANPWAGVPVLVNQSMAKHFWPGQDPLGKRFYYGHQDPAVVEATLGKVEWSEEWDQRYPTPNPLQVVGVVADVKTVSLQDDAPMAYYSSNVHALDNLYVRVAGSPAAMIPELRRAIESVDPELQVSSAETMTQRVQTATADTRFRATLLGLFAGLAILMTGLGLFGVLAYAVSRRTHEMAVRISLGARKEQVSRMVVLDGLKLTVPGIVAGCLLAVGTLRLTSSLLYGVEPTDPLTLAAASGLILVVSLTACWLPALRATRVEPMAVLRED